MVFRCRRYHVAPGKTEAFNEFFEHHLLPVQKRHGARLVGRWQSDDGRQIMALWAYESRDEHASIQARVRTDPDSLRAQEHRRLHLDPLFTETEELFMTSTVPLSVTELRHLADEPA